MSAPDEAVAVFRSAQALEAVIDELSDNGFKRAELSLLAGAAVVAGAGAAIGTIFAKLIGERYGKPIEKQHEHGSAFCSNPDSSGNYVNTGSP